MNEPTFNEGRKSMFPQGCSHFDGTNTGCLLWNGVKQKTFFLNFYPLHASLFTKLGFVKQTGHSSCLLVLFLNTTLMKW